MGVRATARIAPDCSNPSLCVTPPSPSGGAAAGVQAGDDLDRFRVEWLVVERVGKTVEERPAHLSANDGERLMMLGDEAFQSLHRGLEALAAPRSFGFIPR